MSYVNDVPMRTLLAAGQKQEVFKDIRDARFSPDGKHVAYFACTKDWWHVVVDGRKSDTFHEVGALGFSEDGKLATFGARKGRQFHWKVVSLE